MGAAPILLPPESTLSRAPRAPDRPTAGSHRVPDSPKLKPRLEGIGAKA